LAIGDKLKTGRDSLPSNESTSGMENEYTLLPYCNYYIRGVFHINDDTSHVHHLGL